MTNNLFLNLGFHPAELFRTFAGAAEELDAGTTLMAFVRLALRKAAKA